MQTMEIFAVIILFFLLFFLTMVVLKLTVELTVATVGQMAKILGVAVMADTKEPDDFNPDKEKDKQYGQRKYGRVMKNKDDDDGVHRSQNLTDYFPGDTRLREYGFTIYARPNVGEAIWIRGTVPYSESEALHLVNELEQAEKISLEEAA